MSLLGSDFNSATPADAGYVQKTSGSQLATDLRDLKTRIKAFFDVGFRITEPSGDVNSGPDENPADESIPTSALKDLSPNPETLQDPWKMVQVNRKGLVTAGRADDERRFPRPFRAVFYPAYWDGTAYASYNGVAASGGAWYDQQTAKVSCVQVAKGRTLGLGEGVFPPNSWDDGMAARAPEALTTHYTFTFDDPTVKRIKATVVGSGRGRGEISTVACSGILSDRTLNVAVAESIMGLSCVGPFKSNTWIWSNAYGNGTLETAPKDWDWLREDFTKSSRYPGYGGGAGPGLVILEWYA